MRLALELANQNKGLTGLNPSVGCVVTYKDEIISYGKTDINGRPHAEVVALKRNLMNLKFQKSTGQLEKTAEIKKTRSKIARLKTNMNQILGEQDA